MKMKKLTTILLFFSIFLTLSRSQDFADGISYQAVALDENGREISETDISVRFSILGSPELTEEHLYQEVHITDTDVRGLFTVIIGHGTVTESSLTDAPGDIDWGANDLYLAVEIDINNEGEFRLMGVQQMMHVPFAMHAASARSYSMQSGSWHDPEEAVFQVKNSSGEVVFAVYESGVEINVGEGTSKGSRGGFAVGGFSSQKQGQSVEYLRVDPGFVGVNIDDITDPDGSKGSRGGFAVGGFSAAKSGSPDYINISPQGTEIFLEQGSAKGTRGGFAVGGFSPSKSYLSNDYLIAGGDSVRVYIDDSENEKGSRGGFAVGGFSAAKGEGPEFMRVDPGYLRFSIDQEDESKGSRGGFAVGGFSSQKGGKNDYLSLTPGLAQFAYDTLLAKGSRGGFAVGGFSSQKSDPVSDYLYITADSVRMSIMSPATKSTRGGFAIAERSSAKSPGNDIFYLTPDITEIYTKDGGSKLLGGFTVYGFDEFQQEAGLFQVTEQVTTVTTVFAVVPVVSTGEITDITTDSATGNGEVLEDGNAEVTGRGLVWGTSPGPRISANEGITIEADGSGAFTSAVTGLSPGLLYYLRAYATNKAGSGYGEEKTFYTDNIITATAGENGTIDPEGEIILERDQLQVFTISPDSGYEIDDVTLGGVSVLGNVSIDEGTGIGTYNFTNNITGPKILAATFRESDFIATVTDIDGNNYEVVTIGTQVWMAENLKTTRYRNGDAISNPGEIDWETYSGDGAYIVYDHTMAEADGINSQEEMTGHYGLMYSFGAVNNLSGLCPARWYAPTLEDYSILVDYLGGDMVAGGKLKSTRTDPDAHPRWDSPNEGATNETGFSGLPGGMYDYGFYDLGYSGNWWTSSTVSEYAEFGHGGQMTKGGNEQEEKEDGDSKEGMTGDEGFYVGLTTFGTDTYYGEDWSNQSAYSVRCIYGFGIPRVKTLQVSDTGLDNALIKGFVWDDGGSSLTAVGMVWDTQPEPDLGNNEGFSSETPVMGEFASTMTGLSPGTVYYARAWATNSEGNTGYGKVISFTTYLGTVDDADGNSYYTVGIGDQVWIAGNLRTSVYNDATPITGGLSNVDWTNAIDGAYAVYPHAEIEGLNSDVEVLDTYGAFYNWHAVATGNLCPAGWRVPSDEDWKVMEIALGMPVFEADQVSERGYNIAGMLRSARTVPDNHPRWEEPNSGATNMSSFTALPAGMRASWDGTFSGTGWSGTWWTATEDQEGMARTRVMYNDINVIERPNSEQNSGFSVRCILDDGLPQVKTVVASNITTDSAESGGEVLDAGTSAVIAQGIVWSTTPGPTIDVNEGINNDLSLENPFILTMTGLDPSSTYYYRAFATNTEGTGYGIEYSFTTYFDIVNDLSGNTYYTVMIGAREWMAENLGTLVYSTGEPISEKTDITEWGNDTQGAYSWYNNDQVTYSGAYGALYNWHAVNNPDGLCPAGWHVPTDEEWKDMELTLGMDPAEADLTGYRGDDEGGMLKESGLEHWYSPNSGATNSTGFTARPGGTRDNNGSFFDIGFNAWFWTSTDFENIPYSRNIDTYDSGISRINYVGKNYGLSIRCIRNN